MPYLRREDLTKRMQSIFDRLAEPEQRRLLHPQADVLKAEKIQGVVMEALKDANDQGQSDDQILQLMQDYATTDWP